MSNEKSTVNCEAYESMTSNVYINGTCAISRTTNEVVLAAIWLESSLERLFTNGLHYFNEREQD